MSEASGKPRTHLIPLDESGCLDDANWIPYLIVQVADDEATRTPVADLLRNIAYVRVDDPDDDVIDPEATESMVRSELEAAGFTVLLTAVARGLTWMKI